MVSQHEKDPWAHRLVPHTGCPVVPWSEIPQGSTLGWKACSFKSVLSITILCPRTIVLAWHFPSITWVRRLFMPNLKGENYFVLLCYFCVCMWEVGFWCGWLYYWEVDFFSYIFWPLVCFDFKLAGHKICPFFNWSTLSLQI